MMLATIDTETLTAKFAVELEPAHVELLARFPLRRLSSACLESEVAYEELAFRQRLRCHLDRLVDDPVYRQQAEVDAHRYGYEPACPSCGGPVEAEVGCIPCRWERSRAAV